jgi:hypothetical protein
MSLRRLRSKYKDPKAIEEEEAEEEAEDEDAEEEEDEEEELLYTTNKFLQLPLHAPYYIQYVNI